MTDRSNWDNAPAWFKWTLHEVGVKEKPGRGSNPRVIEYRKLAKISIEGDDSDVPYCSIGVNAAFEVNGVRGTRNAMARSFEHSEFFRKLDKPTLGCVVTFWRKSPKSGLGHVTFYRGETDSHIYGLGFNQGDKVGIDPFRKKSATFGFSGFYWPVSVPIAPAAFTGVIPIRAGMPLSQGSVV